MRLFRRHIHCVWNRIHFSHVATAVGPRVNLLCLYTIAPNTKQLCCTVVGCYGNFSCYVCVTTSILVISVATRPAAAASPALYSRRNTSTSAACRPAGRPSTRSLRPCKCWLLSVWRTGLGCFGSSRVCCGFCPCERPFVSFWSRISLVHTQQSHTHTHRGRGRQMDKGTDGRGGG